MIVSLFPVNAIWVNSYILVMTVLLVLILLSLIKSMKIQLQWVALRGKFQEM